MKEKSQWRLLEKNMVQCMFVCIKRRGKGTVTIAEVMGLMGRVTYNWEGKRTR